jgi:hypothetical protein
MGPVTSMAWAMVLARGVVHFRVREPESGLEKLWSRRIEALLKNLVVGGMLHG